MELNDMGIKRRREQYGKKLSKEKLPEDNIRLYDDGFAVNVVIGGFFGRIQKDDEYISMIFGHNQNELLNSMPVQTARYSEAVKAYEKKFGNFYYKTDFFYAFPKGIYRIEKTENNAFRIADKERILESP